MVHKFVKDVKGYSGSTSPPAIILIGDIFTRISNHASTNVKQTHDVVALVFARARNKAGNVEIDSCSTWKN
ncbi:hypothetical protein V6N13_045381 [Hibiscus sabdariffa]